MPPAPGPATAARTSSRDSSLSGWRSVAQRSPSKITRNWHHGPFGRKLKGVRRSGVRTVPAPRTADDGGGADDRDRGTGGGDRGLLTRDAPAGHRVAALALAEQDAQRLGVAEPRVPAGRP